jgi:hypothetical protein
MEGYFNADVGPGERHFSIDASGGNFMRHHYSVVESGTLTIRGETIHFTNLMYIFIGSPEKEAKAFNGGGGA